jgi:hypothetical protein
MPKYETNMRVQHIRTGRIATLLLFERRYQAFAMWKVRFNDGVIHSLAEDELEQGFIILPNSENHKNTMENASNHQFNVMMGYTSAPDLLARAAALMAERGKQYDNSEGERSMAKTVKAFNAITGKTLSEPEGWLFMQILKDVRLFSKREYHADSAEDGVAYSALKAEAYSKQGAK